MSEVFQISRHRKRRVTYSRRNKQQNQGEKKRKGELNETSLPDVEKARERLHSLHLLQSFDGFQINNNLLEKSKEPLQEVDLENISSINTDAFYNSISLESSNKSTKVDKFVERDLISTVLPSEKQNDSVGFDYCEEEPPIMHLNKKKQIIAVEVRTRRCFPNGESQVELSILHPVTFKTIADKDLPRKIRHMRKRVRSQDEKPLPIKKFMTVSSVRSSYNNKNFSFSESNLSSENVVSNITLNPRRNLMTAFEKCEQQKENSNQIKSAAIKGYSGGVNTSPKAKSLSNFAKKTSTPKNLKDRPVIEELKLSPIELASDNELKSGTINSSEIHVTYEEDSDINLCLEETDDSR
ncbi:DgyrCDS11643 [Dimorphilus gyrociliatus]|uniref:DgyrCDS11643 n=1 Tax=Dimorphilus gyrociliatus TaxID=2664684 RepID=A0A7I8W3Z8_9ANNE|nr:DgyrCDS11643 [Dimorphilus gyrociliatus]